MCMCSLLNPVMGLKNAPSIFQWIMEKVLFSEHPELRQLVFVCVVDVISATEGNGLTEKELVVLHLNS